MSMKTYDPTNWYWIVAEDPTRAFSSARNAYVPASDAALQAWGADGTPMTAIDTDANLQAVLAAANVLPAVMPQDLMAQFTAEDAAKIQAAINGNVSFWLLWQAMTAQRDRMVLTNARFQQGWASLVSVLGTSRMNAIASALGVSSAL